MSAGSYVGSVTDRNGDGPYLDLDRDAWRGLRASTPMSLTAEGLEAVRGLGDPIQLGEVEDIYLPLSRLLRLYFQASAGLRETAGAFLGQQAGPAPFIIGSPAASPPASPPPPGCSRRSSRSGRSARAPSW
jgi:pantothenate kinase